jgi:RND family efflux transporter MFP subunit
VAAPPVVEVGGENITIVANGELQSGPSVSGTLEARNMATVRAEVSGPVVQTYVERGQAVTRGQLLARLDDTALQQAMLSAQSADASAKLSLENARRNFQRSDTLEKAGAIAERDLELAQSQLAAARAASADAGARLTQAQQQLDKTFIRAPFGGLVSDRPVNAGDVVQPGTALVTVIDPRSMRLEASVPSEQIAALRVRAPVRFAVSGYPGRTFIGRIDQINPAADPVTRQVRIYVSIPNEGSALVAGLFAQGRVATETRTALLAPVSAVDQRGVTPVVMRIKGGKAERVAVQLGIRDDVRSMYEITSGIVAGDTLLLGAAQGITPGTPVRVVVASDRTTAER